MRSKFQQLALALALALAASALCAQMALARKDKETSSSQMPEQKRAIHALNRLTFGPRPGDSNRVMAMGVDQWIDQQLHPDKIDDHALEARLAPLRTLRMDTRDIVENFPPEQVIKAVAEGSSLFPPIHPNALFTKHSWSALNRNKSANKEVLMQLWPREKHGSQMMNAHAAARSGCMPI